MLQTKKGQALVEFVMILPIFIFMLFACIDLGKILYLKNNMESRMDDVITSFESKKEVSEIIKELNLEKENITLKTEKKEDYREFTLEKKIELITPGLNLVLKNPYEAVVKRVIYNE